jgi:hypothetical protein
MRMIRIIALATVLAFLVEAVSVPQRAEALSSGEIAAIVVGAVVGWFTLVFVGAYFVYRKPPPEEAQPQDLAPGASALRNSPQRRLRFGPECPAMDGPLAGIRPTACW